MSNILIAYFSRAGENYVNGQVKNLPVGNTEVVARMAAEITGGDLFRIETVHAYAKDYRACTDEAAAEKRVDARPQLKALPESIDGYDRIVLAYPNWWGTMPMAVYAFLKVLDCSGKTILPLCTHEGSGLAGTEGDIARTCPGATVLARLAIRGSRAAHARPELERWLGQALPKGQPMHAQTF